MPRPELFSLWQRLSAARVFLQAFLRNVKVIGLQDRTMTDDPEKKYRTDKTLMMEAYDRGEIQLMDKTCPSMCDWSNSKLFKATSPTLLHRYGPASREAPRRGGLADADLGPTPPEALPSKPVTLRWPWGGCDFFLQPFFSLPLSSSLFLCL